MRVEKAQIGDFLCANRRTAVIQIIPYLLQGGQSGLDRLSQIAEFQKLILENPKDIEQLEGLYLVWYKPNSRGEAGWDRAGCQNYTVVEYVDSLLKGDVCREDIAKLVDSLKKGLDQNIELVVAFDTLLDKHVIVDGCKRAVALSLIAKQKQQDLLNSSFKISITELKSRWAHSLYPCDFLAFEIH